MKIQKIVLSALVCSSLFLAASNTYGEEVSSKDIVIDLSFNKSADQVWKVFTSQNLLEQWLTVKANVQPKLGGSYELYWEPNNPEQNSTIGCKIISYVPDRLLAFQWKGPVPFADVMNSEPLPTWVSITIEAGSSQTTILHFRHSGWGDGEKWDEARKWQLNAWNLAFEKLRQLEKSK